MVVCVLPIQQSTIIALLNYALSRYVMCTDEIEAQYLRGIISALIM